MGRFHRACEFNPREIPGSILCLCADLIFFWALGLECSSDSQKEFLPKAS